MNWNLKLLVRLLYVATFMNWGIMVELGSENPLFQKLIGENVTFGAGEGELGRKNGKESFGVMNRALFYSRME